MISMMSAISAINPSLANVIAIKQNPGSSDFYGNGSPSKVEARYNKIIKRLIALEGESLSCAEIAEMCDISVTTAQKNMLIIEHDCYCSSRKVRRIVRRTNTTIIEFFIRT